ncbi:hypothetical protein NDU88_002113 [Pleurodeles waltl]|uniref:Secreted protein n=1 Tax=Pleurodeles waltl TaxID=8319 RepID=A0AAV7MQG2_PLEWA|nr:hypothetical protein NDU88_002113 [Pleurodeles waltl]
MLPGCSLLTMAALRAIMSCGAVTNTYRKSAWCMDLCPVRGHDDNIGVTLDRGCFSTSMSSRRGSEKRRAVGHADMQFYLYSSCSFLS